MQIDERITVTGYGKTLKEAKENAAAKLRPLVDEDVYLNNDVPRTKAWRPMSVYSRLVETVGGVVLQVEADVDFEFTIGNT